MKKIAINRCFGCFSISKKAVKRMAELYGKECYFFKHDYKTNKYTPIDIEVEEWSWIAFTIPNPNEYLGNKSWKDMSPDEREENNEKYEKIDLDCRPSDRADPFLIQAIEELGKESWGDCSELKIVEIPDDLNWEIDEYDGVESVREISRSYY